MNIKELHNPTFRQEDNRLYLVGNIEKQPDSENYYDNSGWCDNERYKSDHKMWEKSKVKYPVRESSEEAIKLNLRSHTLYTPWTFNNRIVEGITVPPELMDRLELLNTDLFHDGNYQNFCSQCKVAFMGHKRQSVCKKCCDSKIIVTLKEEPKGESEDLMTKDSARAYLEKEGLNVDELVMEGLDFIDTVKKRIELQKRWIPVTDVNNYPKDHQQVFMCFENEDVAVGYFCDDVNASWWSNYFIDNPNAKITHWMPYELPTK